MKLQKINDERLIIKNMKNIRLVYALQTFGIIGVLGFDIVSYGLSTITENPLWIVFLASTVVLIIMSFGSSDERLALKGLQKIRVAYAIQLLGIVGVLGFDLVGKGMDAMQENPLWLIFILSTLVLTVLSMNISVDYEDSKIDERKGIAISTVVLALISTVVGFLTVYTDKSSSIIDGVLAGGLLFVCGFLSFLFLFMLRRNKKKS